MKLSQFLSGVLIIPIVGIVAFPAIMLEAAAKAAEGGAKEKRCPYAEMNDKSKRVNGVGAGFDPAAQLIDVSGAHAFVPPSSTDLRGPCPGLNALANHNYLPHDGWASITQFVEQTNKGSLDQTLCIYALY